MKQKLTCVISYLNVDDINRHINVIDNFNTANQIKTLNDTDIIIIDNNILNNNNFINTYNNMKINQITYHKYKNCY